MMHLRVTIVTERDPQGHGGYYQRQPLIIILRRLWSPLQNIRGSCR